MIQFLEAWKYFGAKLFLAGTFFDEADSEKTTFLGILDEKSIARLSKEILQH